MIVFAFAGFLSILSGFSGKDITLFQKLNQELGALCQSPPTQAIRVCQLHARLING